MTLLDPQLDGWVMPIILMHMKMNSLVKILCCWIVLWIGYDGIGWSWIGARMVEM